MKRTAFPSQHTLCVTKLHPSTRFIHHLEQQHPVKWLWLRSQSGWRRNSSALTTLWKRFFQSIHRKVAMVTQRLSHQDTLSTDWSMRVPTHTHTQAHYYAYTHTHTLWSMFVYIHTHTFKSTFVYAHIQACSYTYTSTFVYTHRKFVCTHTSTFIYLHKSPFVYTHTHTHRTLSD